jgi:hypothetical protein
MDNIPSRDVIRYSAISSARFLAKKRVMYQLFFLSILSRAGQNRRVHKNK